MAKKKKTDESKDGESKTTTKMAVDIINKKYGDGAIQIGRGTFVSCEVIPTGIANIDVATGCGGLPRARIIEIYGNESYS